MLDLCYLDRKGLICPMGKQPLNWKTDYEFLKQKVCRADKLRRGFPNYDEKDLELLRSGEAAFIKVSETIVQPIQQRIGENTNYFFTPEFYRGETCFIFATAERKIEEIEGGLHTQTDSLHERR